jgi:hypothetical protein
VIDDVVEQYRRDRIVLERTSVSNAPLVDTIDITQIAPTTTNDLLRVCPIHNRIIIEPDATLTITDPAFLQIDLINFPTRYAVYTHTWKVYAYINFFHTDTRSYLPTTMSVHDFGSTPSTPVITKITDTNNPNTYIDRQSEYWVRFTTDKKVYSTGQIDVILPGTAS